MAAATSSPPAWHTFLSWGVTEWDVALAADTVARFEGYADAWRADHGDDELGDAELWRLLGSSLDAALDGDAASRVSLGLTGGFDSRPMLLAALDAGLRPYLYTFGQAGLVDFDLVSFLTERLSLGVHVIDTSTMTWSLEELEEDAATTSDLPLSPRGIVANIVTRAIGPRRDLHGYLNGALTGNTRSKSATPGSAIDEFVHKNNPFKLHAVAPPDRAPLRDLVADTAPSLDDYSRLDLGFRQAQRIRLPAARGARPVFPYESAEWVGYWLTRGVEAVREQRRWIRFIGTLDADVFPDLDGLEYEPGRLRRDRLRRIYGHGATPPMVSPPRDGIVLPRNPTTHFCAYSCYRNNASFRRVVDTSLARLRRRRIFPWRLERHIIRRFHAGEAKSADQLKGLVSIDIAIAAGRVSPAPRLKRRHLHSAKKPFRKLTL